MTNVQEKEQDNSNSPATYMPVLEFFIQEMKDIYWSENYLLKALPKMQLAATSFQLKQAFGEHLLLTQKHIARLEKIFTLLNIKAKSQKCEELERLIEMVESMIRDTKEGSPNRDVCLIFAVQNMEHYEIATYDSLSRLAQASGMGEIQQIVLEILKEEKEANVRLTTIAENSTLYNAIIKEPVIL